MLLSSLRIPADCQHTKHRRCNHATRVAADQRRACSCWGVRAPMITSRDRIAHRHSAGPPRLDQETADAEAAPLLQRPAGTPHQHEGPPTDWLATGLCFAFPAIGGLLFGYDIGATSGVLVSLGSEKLSGTDWYQLSSLQSGLVVSSSLFGALAASVVTFTAGNRIGRKTELLIAAALYGISGAVMGAAPSLNILLLGRTMYGVGMGFAMHAAPAYIAETAPPTVRGVLISAKEGVIVGGILLGYLASYLFIDAEGGWRSMYGLATPLALALGAGMATLPESPRWLLLNGAPRDQAVRALVRAEGKRAADRSVVEAEVDEMADNIERIQREGADNPMQLFSESRYYRPLLVGMSLMLFQQITGQPSVLYYAAKIFEEAGFAAGQESTGVSVILGGFKLAMTIVAVLTVDSWGRRPLLLYGVGGLTAALVALAAAQAGGPASGATAWISAAALLVYVGAYQMSFGPISWLLVGEVFPLAVRGQAIALATFVNFSSNFLVSLVLPSFQETYGMSVTYSAFALIGLVALTVIYLTVPETKGKTLEEIERLFRDEDVGSKQLDN